MNHDHDNDDDEICQQDKALHTNHSNNNNNNNSDDDDDDDDDDNLDFTLDDEPLIFYPLCTTITVDETTRNSTTSPSSSFQFPSLSLALQYDENHYKFHFLQLLPSTSDEFFFEKSILLMNQSRIFIHHHSQDSSSLLSTFAEEEEEVPPLSSSFAIGPALEIYLLQFIQSESYQRYFQQRHHEEDITDTDAADDEGEMEVLFRPFLHQDAWLQSLEDLYELKRFYEQQDNSKALATTTHDTAMMNGGCCTMPTTTIIHSTDNLNHTTKPIDLSVEALQQRVLELEDELRKAQACIARLTKEDNE